MRVSRTKSIPMPNEYVRALAGEYSRWSFDEEQAPKWRGKWRSEVFAATADQPLDLEIGMGNGLHFAHRARMYPQRLIVGLELRYKPLIQSIRRALNNGCENARVARYNAFLPHEIFENGEIDDVFIFFPDPWEKLRQRKHRLIQDQFLQKLFEVQKPGSRLFFKTDSQSYFAEALECFQRSPYEVVGFTHDLHHSEYAPQNFITQFESIFIRQGLKIGYAELKRR